MDGIGIGHWHWAWGKQGWARSGCSLPYFLPGHPLHLHTLVVVVVVLVRCTVSPAPHRSGCSALLCSGTISHPPLPRTRSRLPDRPIPLILTLHSHPHFSHSFILSFPLPLPHTLSLSFPEYAAPSPAQLIATTQHWTRTPWTLAHLPLHLYPITHLLNHDTSLPTISIIPGGSILHLSHAL